MLIVAASVGITPQEFWGNPHDISTGMTLREFDLYVQGVQRKLEREQHLVAWHCANLMNCWISKGSKITVNKLLGKKEKSVADIIEEQKMAEMIEKQRD